jgi:hypothetical protein
MKTKMKMTPEEKKIKQAASTKCYVESLSPEETEARKEAKKIKRIEKRELERIDLAVEELVIAEALLVKPSKKKVIPQPVNTWTLKEIAKYLDMRVPAVREILNNTDAFNMPAPTEVRVDGADLWDTFTVMTWAQVKRETIAQAAIIGASRKNKNGITIQPHIMMLIEWMQAAKHVQEYCNKQRFAINSASLWSKYGEAA